MPASRNPFFIRTAEQSESDDQFLNLFSLSVLDLLREDGSWNRLLPIESPPGAGKSTLLRLFTPTVLTTIATRRHQSDFAKLADKLSDLDAIDANGVPGSRGARQLQGRLQQTCRPLRRPKS